MDFERCKEFGVLAASEGASGYRDGRDASYVLSWSAFDGLVQDAVQSWASLERVGQHVDMLERCLGVVSG